LKNNELNALNVDEFGQDDDLDVSAGGEAVIADTSSNEASEPASDETATGSSENAVTETAGNTVNQAVSDPAAPMAPLVDTITASNAAGNAGDAGDAGAAADINTGEETPVLASADDTQTNVAQNNAVTAPLITETAPAVNSDDTAVLADTSNASIEAISGSNDRMPNGGSAVATSRDPANEITIRAVASSWVEIVRNDGEEVMTKLMRSGDIYLIDSGENLYLSTGNAGGLEFVLNDGLVLSAGDVGEILRDLPLKPEGLINKL
jgi:cytoskeletal protein RodZ